jgi:hypothetical protein
VSARTSARAAVAVDWLAVEEFFLHLWDELDDVVGVCRHVAAAAATEVVGAAAPLIAATSGALLAGAAALLLAQQHIRNLAG